MGQMAFSLPHKSAFGRSDFIVSECNKEAIGWIDAWPKWPFHVLVIYGPAGAGKTHLAHVFSDFHINAADLKEIDFEKYPNKIVVENIDQGVDEEVLFHLYNYTKEVGKTVMLVARVVPEFQLPDLASRMNAALKVKINAPDDELLFALLVKGFADRGIVVPANVLEYVIKNSERSFKAVQEFLEKADRLSLEKKRAITIPIAKEVLDF